MTDRSYFDMTEDEKLDGNLDIDVSSAASLQKALLNASKIEARYHKAYAKAVKDAETLELNIVIETALIMKRLEKEAADKGKPIAPTARAEYRRTKVPLDPVFQKLSRKFIEANEKVNTLRGLTFVFSNKSKRLTELGHLMNRILNDGPKVYERNYEKRADQAAEGMNFD